MKPPTSTGVPVRLLERRQHVVAQVVDEVRRRRRLRGRVGVGLDDRDLARRRRSAARVTATTSGVALTAARSAGSAAVWPRPRQLGDEQQRAVEARAEALREQVEGLARAGVGRVVAGVAACRAAARTPAISSAIITASETIASGHGRACTDLAPPRATPTAREAALPRGAVAASIGRLRDAEQPRVRRAGARAGRRSARAAPAAASARRASVSSTASTEAIASPYMKLTPVANMPSRAITTVVPASRIARPEVSIASITERSTSPNVEVVLAEARDDEQRVVDPDAEADHQRQLGRDVGHARDVRGEPDQRDAGDQAEAGGDQRHPRRDQRAERDQQDDQRRDHADRGRRADAEALGLLDHLAARGDLQPGHVHRVDLR